MRTADFEYELPPELIAQSPPAQREQSRLLVLDRSTEKILHCHFPDLINYLVPGDVLVMNDTRVIPARLRGCNAQTGGQFEMLLLEENSTNDWWVMLRPGKRARVGTRILLNNAAGSASGVCATILASNEEGHRRLQFTGVPNILQELDALGEVPLPPYIAREKTPTAEDRERYQTVYARAAGSVAAPTAGLHFTEPFLNSLSARGIQICFVTLHVGLGTFAPVKAETLSAHKMHEERFVLSDETAAIINEAKQSKRRIIAVGTTSVRVLESAANESARVVAGHGRTSIFIYPPHQFKIVDALLTNFHLPRSTLLMLVSAFATPGETRGRNRILAAYAEAIRERYRFFSYGDAMLIV